MKFLSFPAAVFAVGMLLSSCGGGAETKTDDAPAQPEKPAEKVCTYAYEATNVIINWTSYKHTNKVGVTGKFDTFGIEGAKSAGSIAELVSDAAFSIDASSVNSGDEVRDPKLRDMFFGIMENAGEISGKFSAVTGTDEEGAGKVTINMNGATHTADMTYAVEDGNLKVRTAFDMLTAFNGQKPYDSIAEACAEKHTGGDGERVFWPDVNVVVTIPFTKECN